jgi:hypothetical protein
MVSPVQSPAQPATVSGPRQQAWLRALERARLVSTRNPLYHPSRDCYSVYSNRAGNTYTVYPIVLPTSLALSYACTCQAGAKGQVCWHAALCAALPGECLRRRVYRDRPHHGIPSYYELFPLPGSDADEAAAYRTAEAYGDDLIEQYAYEHALDRI